MSFAYMKALESSPERYDKGIKILGWGRIRRIRCLIADLIKICGGTVLEIGIGTGEQAVMLAEEGMEVTGIDNSVRMLTQAQKRLDSIEELESGSEVVSRIKLLHKCAVQIDEFEDNSFDVVTSTLVFSELYEIEQLYVLKHAVRILKPGGLLVIADEVVPDTLLRRLLYRLFSSPIKLITYIITQNSTSGVHDMETKLLNVGLNINSIYKFQIGFFKVVSASKRKESDSTRELMEDEVYEKNFAPIRRPRGGIITTLWETVMRLFGHQTSIGLISVGQPAKDSPILCTCNFKLTVVRLYKVLLKNNINCWLLVAPTNGINVWCASCGDNFNAGSVITAVKVTQLSILTEGKTIILPQLAASGVDPKEVRKATGYKVVWGPVHMDDIPSFLSSYPDSARNKTERQRKVRFDLKDRFEMASSISLLLMLCTGVVLFAFHALFFQYFVGFGILGVLTLQLYVPYIFWPILPFNTGKMKVYVSFLAIVILLLPTGLLVFLPLMLIVMFLAAIDVDGMTPIRRSSYAASSFNRGKVKVTEKWGKEFSVSKYGRIAIDSNKCIVCGICVDVCPMLIPTMNKVEKKISLICRDSCVNCRACINQCPVGALDLELETKAAREAYAELLEKHGIGEQGEQPKRVEIAIENDITQDVQEDTDNVEDIIIL